jgi:hypothetical protein
MNRHARQVQEWFDAAIQNFDRHQDLQKRRVQHLAELHMTIQRQIAQIDGFIRRVDSWRRTHGQR